MSDLFPEDLYATWEFQDKFREIAVNLLNYGVGLGALSLAKNILAAEIANGNKTLRPEELKMLIDKVKIEARAEIEKGLENVRESRTDTN